MINNEKLCYVTVSYRYKAVFGPYQVVTSRFLAFTFHDITLYVVNNHLIVRTMLEKSIFNIFFNFKKIM
jgi:hypothetical protein